ncbi:MAG: tetratricopeptide repeat protein [Polyangiaceae bacterium]|jgi:tetratricopeptide (TPR) repeat protein
MTEPKKPDPLEDMDWDQALAEWEDKSFDPEVARDVISDRPAALSGGPATRPLYRPPSMPAYPTKATPATPLVASAAANLTVGPPPSPRLPDEDDGDATMIAAIPEELLRRHEHAPRAGSRGGGLGQLFAREPVESAPTLPPASTVRSELHEEVITSAQAVSSRREQPTLEPLRRAPRIDASEAVPDGAFFDPFTEPRPPQITIPAAEEVVTETSVDIDVFREGSDQHAVEHAPASSDDESLAARSTAVPAPPHADPEPAAEQPGRYNGFGDGESRSGLTAPSKMAPSWEDEKQAASWLDEPERLAMHDRSLWLEEEARATLDERRTARGLLICSELSAISGDRERALGLAAEARDLEPSLALAHRQMRALLPWPPDPDDCLEALEREVALTPPGPARLHSSLLAVEALRARGEEELGDEKLAEASRAGPPDVRAAIAQAARALARGDLSSPALQPTGAPELASLERALAVCLRLRGLDRSDSPGEAPTPSEIVLRARRAVEHRELGTAATTIAQLSRDPELAAGALWLAASLAATSSARRQLSIGWLRELIDGGDEDAPRALVARLLELGDVELLTTVLAGRAPLTSAEIVTVAALAGCPLSASDPRLDAAMATGGMLPLAAAIAAAATPTGTARTRRTAGSRESRAQVALGRHLAADDSTDVLAAALTELGPESPGTNGVAIELASRTGRAEELSQIIESWGASRLDGADRALVSLGAALVAERAGAPERALEAFRSACEADPTLEAALRGRASLDTIDLAAEMNKMADECGEGLRSALARLEAVARSHGSLPEPTQTHLLELAHRAAATLPIAAFLAERIARKASDVDGVLRWIRERRANAIDPIEAALEGVREALLVADHDPDLASERLREAQAIRPADVALRDLYERMSAEPPHDRAAWKEQNAASAQGGSRVLLLLEAAHEYERIGDDEGSYRCAVASASGNASLARIALERAELRTGRVARLADELLATAKEAGDLSSKREAYERLAVLDAAARDDSASALLWHRLVLENVPDHKPSLRYVEHHLIGEGRNDELEPVATAIAIALRGSGAGECTAHAELAARLRIRAEAGHPELAQDMVELAAGEPEPSLWSLRALQSHARARSDDAAVLDVTKRLADRATRSADLAALLLRAAEAAMRLDWLDEARAFLQRASLEDPGDVVTWWSLADVRRRSRDYRGAAEACEALARCSGVPQHRFLAWSDAGRLWMDDVHDEERAIPALEAAASIDMAQVDVFDRLARLYAARKMHLELAELLERRLECVADLNERLAIEVRRGRALLEVGDLVGARHAFQAALLERPEEPSALSALADLAVSQGDWDAAESAFVRLARLLPTADEQREVYERLGDIYSHRLPNLARAEVALKEVLKRAPNDDKTTRKLVDIYKRQNDPARAVELQQELVARAQTPEERRGHFLELASIHEHLSRDLRRAEKALEAARRELPHDVSLLRALAEFYARHQQAPAVNILLDRAGAEARRTLAAGRVSSGPFDVIATIFTLRGKSAAATDVQGILAAVEGSPTAARGSGDRAFDSELDDLLAPETMTPAIRTLLARTGDALEAAAPVDFRELRATPVSPDLPIARLVLRAAGSIGLAGLEVLSSPWLGDTCIPVGAPPAIVLGEGLVHTAATGAFLALRALKLVRARAAALGRTESADLPVVVSAWLKALNPGWQPQGVATALLNAAVARVHAALPRVVDADIGTLALEASATMDGRQATLSFSALTWANRVALLALGDPAAALDAIAMASGLHGGAPSDPLERVAWVSRNLEARDLVAFGVTDAFAQARALVGVDG